MEKDQSEILHKDNIHTYTDELDHLKEELEMLTSKKVELAKVIEQNKVEYISLDEMKENLTKDLKAALVQISDLETSKEAMTNEIVKASKQSGELKEQYGDKLAELMLQINAVNKLNENQEREIVVLKEKNMNQSSQIEKATKEKLDMEKQYRNHDAELNGLYEQRKEGDAKEIQDLASANKALNERLRAVNKELEDLKNRSTNIESSYKLEVEGLQSKLEQIEIDAKKENEQRDMIVQHFSTERSELNSSISKRDELIKEMTATKEKLSMDVKRYLEELKMYENKCMEEETKSANLSKELKSSAETTRVLKLEKIVFEENIADLEEKLSNREKMKLENVSVANAKIKEVVKTNELQLRKIDKLKEEKELLSIEIASKTNAMKQLKETHKSAIKILNTKLESEGKMHVEALRQTKEINTELQKSFETAEKTLFKQKQINGELEFKIKKSEEEILLIHGRNQQLQSQKMDSLTEIESLQSKITLLEAQLEQSVEIGQESSLLKDSVDSYKDVIKKLRSEHRILKTNSVNEITRYKAEVEILKERVEILESTDSSRMLEEQLKLEKTAHSSNILALKTKMENQGKEIEN